MVLMAEGQNCNGSASHGKSFRRFRPVRGKRFFSQGTAGCRLITDTSKLALVSDGALARDFGRK
jgi:hypothetical protein